MNLNFKITKLLYPLSLLLILLFWPGISNGANNFQPSAPYYATFFYPWSENPNTDGKWSYWNDNGHSPPQNWFSNYLPDPDPSKFDPANELYSSNNDSIIYWQLRKLAEAKQEVTISSWWGQGHKTDNTFKKIITDIMNRADNPYPNLRWTIYYEKEGQADPTVSEIVNDLNYIKTNYTNQPAYLKINGKPVIFVYGGATDGSDMASRWAQARSQTGFYVVLKVYSGYKTDPNQPDGWHQYAPAVRTDNQSPYAYSVSPGFWKDGEAVRLARDLTAFRNAVSTMVSANATWKLTTTWNEWGEGTSVEPGEQIIQTKTGSAALDPSGVTFKNAYIDILNQLLPPPEGVLDVPILVGAGDIGTAGTTGKDMQTSDLILGLINSGVSTHVFTAGDNMNEAYAPYSYYTDYFDKSWGRFKDRIRPAIGNHDYAPYLDGTKSYGNGYFDYYNGIGNFTGPAGDRDKGYYSYNLGSWYIVVLNSNCTRGDACGTGTTQQKWDRQMAWLRADLEANKDKVCTAAYWHHPLFSSGQHGNQTFMQPFWQTLYGYGVDVVINGHSHDYERFALQNPDGTADPNGIREFVVGTGGRINAQSWNVQPNSEVRGDTANGVLKLTLHANSYDWQFLPIAGQTFTDSGTSACVTVTTPSTLIFVFTPTDDAYIQTDLPTSNFGSDANLKVDNSPVQHSLLKFSISGIGTQQIISAKLRLYNTNLSAKGGNFYKVPYTTWTQGTVTWNNAPAADPTLLTSLGSVAKDNWYEVDVTPAIIGDGFVSFRVNSTSTDGAWYSSKEGGFAPQLVVTISSVPTPDTQPPTVSITSPTNGQTISGTVNITADASDNIGVTKVELYYDSANLTGTDNTSPYSVSWDTTKVSNGSHTLAAKAYDAAGNVGTSVTVTVNVSNDITPPTISNVAATNITTNSATITWITDEPATSQVEYGLNTTYGNKTTLDSSLKTSHSQTLTGLSAGTLYNYRVISKDAAGNESISINFTFTTTSPPIPDTTPPAKITDLRVTNITETSVTLSWSAPGDDGNQGQAFQYDIRYSTSVISESNFAQAIQVIGEPFPKTAGQEEYINVGLSPSTTYYFILKTSDEVPNWSEISNVVSATTLTPSGGAGAPPSDTIPPQKVANFKAQEGDSQIILSWQNPSDPDFVRVRILRKEDSFPTSPTDGKITYEGRGISFVDTNLQNGKVYYYAIYAYDHVPNYSQIATLKAFPKAGVTSFGRLPTAEKPITEMSIEELLAKIAQLKALIAALQVQLSQLQGIPEIPTDYKFTNPLYLGLRNTDVRYLQIFLKSQGTEIYPKGLVTGYFGLLTREAVIKFQIKYKIVTSASSPGAGLVGIKTRAKINEILGQ